MALSLEGKRLATASDKGTLVRVWNTADGQLLQVRVMLGGGGYAACVSPARSWDVLLDVLNGVRCASDRHLVSSKRPRPALSHLFTHAGAAVRSYLMPSHTCSHM